MEKPNRGRLVSAEWPEVGQSFHGYNIVGQSWHTSSVVRIVTKYGTVTQVETLNSTYDVRILPWAELAAKAMLNKWSIRLSPYSKKGEVIKIERNGNLIEATQKGEDGSVWTIPI